MEALLYLDDGNTPDLQHTIDSLKKDPIDPCREDEFNKERAKWMKQTNSNIYGLAELLKTDLDNKIFVTTEQFKKAEAKLRKDRIVILKGNPGEGKSITAKMLAREVDNKKKWLNINSHADWRRVDVNEHNIIVDDIFGAGVLDIEEFTKWLKHIKDIEASVDKGTIHVIITSRSYILNEALQKMYYRAIFTEKNTIHLSSEALSNEEKKRMLEKHLQKRAEKERLSADDIDACVQCRQESNDFFKIGYPECVRLFCLNDTLLAKKFAFFKKPLFFLKSLLRAIFKQDEKTFLAFFLIWSQKKQTLSIKDIEQSIELTPSHILSPIEKLQFVPGDCLRNVRGILENNKDGFLLFDSIKGNYTFSHSVIGDVVGLISFEMNPTAALAFSSYDFTMCYINLQNLGDDRIFIPPFRYNQLCARLIDYMLIPEDDTHVNGDPIVHSAFEQEAFCKYFIEYIKLNEQQKILSRKVKSDFVEIDHFGIDLKHVSHLPSFSFLRGGGEDHFAMMCFREDLIPKDIFESERDMCSLIACSFGQKKILKYLFENDANVTDEMIIIAGNEGKDEILEFLQQKISDGSKENSPGWKSKKSPLINLMRSGSKLAVEILLERHLDFRELQRKEKECTAMHLACEFNASEIAEIILTKHPMLDRENEQGYYPIHIALERKHTETVRVLLKKDFKNQSSRTLTLTNRLNINRASLLHLAVWKDNADLVDDLTQNDNDGYFSAKLDGNGRTAFVFALNGEKNRCIEKFLDMKMIDKKMPDLDGNTPLHIAIKKAGTGAGQIYATCVTKLLKCEGVNVNIKNKDGDTPLHFTYQYDKTEIRKELVQAPGINHDIKNNDGKTPVQLTECPTSNTKTRTRKKKKGK